MARRRRRETARLILYAACRPLARDGFACVRCGWPQPGYYRLDPAHHPVNVCGDHVCERDDRSVRVRRGTPLYTLIELVNQLQSDLSQGRRRRVAQRLGMNPSTVNRLIHRCLSDPKLVDQARKLLLDRAADSHH